MPDGKRALILAGGGLKVAFQAGVLQVWMDEAKVKFDVADGASGGVFNLAMWCSNQSGRQIANNWRNTHPLDLISLNPRPWVSLATMEAFTKKALPKWNITWGEMKRTQATFNVYNFTRQELQTLEPNQMTPEWLKACVSLPMWFPPVEIDGERYIDSVFATDANLEAAINSDLKPDELWVIWTVSTRGRWGNGFVNQYFQMIENAANSRFKDLLLRIEASNARGADGEFGRHIDMKVLYAEVPLHYLLVFNGDRLHEAVELGVRRGREWCIDNGIPLQ
jgi:predicted patatin/cPLA2 family phospholipase